MLTKGSKACAIADAVACFYVNLKESDALGQDRLSSNARD
jgi:hypothetical protein